MASHMHEIMHVLACQVCAAIWLKPLHHVALIGAKVPASQSRGSARLCLLIGM